MVKQHYFYPEQTCKILTQNSDFLNVKLFTHACIAWLSNQLAKIKWWKTEGPSIYWMFQELADPKLFQLWTWTCNKYGTDHNAIFIHWWSWGGRFKNVYELLNLRALKIPMPYKNHIFRCMGKIFCVEFQRVPLKFHTKYLTHTLKDNIFMKHWNFKSS